MAFNTKTVSNLTGLTIRQLDYWDRTHFIKPSVQEATGYGTVRLYSFEDLVSLRVARTLKDKGVSLQKIRKVVAYLRKNFPDAKKPLAQMRFLTDGESVFVVTRDKKAILDALAGGQLVMSIALGEIIEGLKGEVRKVGQEKKYNVAVQGRTYRVILHPDLEEGGYWVECPSLAGCASQGDSVEEALNMITDAIKGHLEVAAETRRKARKVATR